MNVFTNLSDFKEHIRESVCHLGGDAAIASANGYGMYIKASVLKRVANKPPAPAPVAATPAATVRSHGCEFDTQCKGDRVCVEGKCQEPAAKAAPPAESAVAAAPVASFIRQGDHARRSSEGRDGSGALTNAAPPPELSRVEYPFCDDTKS